MNAEEIKTKVIPTENDVLCGRGNGVNLHPGNQKFRAMIKALKPEYVAASKPDKSSFPYLVVAEIQNAVPPGRFMKYCPKSDQWHELPTKHAITKTRQALREGAPDIVESQKGNPRKTAVYVVDEIKKIVRDAGQTHIPVPSNRGIPCPKATDLKATGKRSSPSPPHQYMTHAPGGEMMARRFDRDISFNYNSYDRPRLSNEDTNYDLESYRMGHLNHLTHDSAKKMKPSFMNVATNAMAPSSDDSNSAMQQLPPQYVAAAALLDLSHRTFTYSGGN